MGVDIKKHIGTILYERDSLIIPDLGGFVTSYKTADFDYVQGLIQPPSKKISFNKNLLINDGVLINSLQESLGLNVEEAKKCVNDFVNRTIEMLNNKEIIFFPGIGRLYKDYENNLKFLQDNTNYYTQSFALPVLQFYPILRAKPASYAATDIVNQPQAASKPFNARRTAAALAPYALVALIVVSSILYFRSGSGTAELAAGPVKIADSLVNQKPSKEHLSVFEGLKNKIVKPKSEEVVELEPVEVLDETEATESATFSPQTKECIIIIGAFGKKSGVEKRVGEIIDLGYSVYQDKKGSLTRVGIQFAYQNDSEIREKLNAMRDNFDNRAWILEE